MKTVYLAEKPSQARDIAKVLGIAPVRRDNYIELTNGDAVVAARGHFYELVEPKEYNPKWGEYWSWDQLPMIPNEFKYQAVHGVGEQLKTIKALFKTADRVVICTDAGREGELIARLIIKQLNFKGKLERFWTSSMVESDVKAALAKLLPGSAKEPLYQAALARQHSDWVMGLSLTRAATLAAGLRGNTFSCGRVQTPTLALVVQRTLAIKNFKEEAFYELEATVTTKKGATFKMKHEPGKETPITTEAEAKRRLNLAKDYTGPIKVEKGPGKESPSLPFDITSLGKAADAAIGIGSKPLLKVIQSLYEKKALTYPRTDCPYLARSQKAEVEATLQAIARSQPDAVRKLRDVGIELRDSTFDDSKLTDHHGIIPTTQYVALEGVEAQVYALVAQRYLEAIASDMRFNQTKLSVNANGIPFKASGRAITHEGWSAIKATMH